MIDQATIARPRTGYSSGRHRRPASRRARPSRLLLACACVTAAAAAAAGCSMLAPAEAPLAPALVTTTKLATSSLDAQWRAYAWRSPEAAAQLAWPSPIAAGDEQMR